jgi:hypothetical protein
LQRLKPFVGADGIDLQIYADLTILDKWTFDFLLKDKMEKVLINQKTGRLDGLWQSTCFEAFVQVAGQMEYWEFNFSPLNAWNIYLFNSYRNPPTPEQSSDFSIGKFFFDGEKLSVEVEPKRKLPKGQILNVGLSAVIQDKNSRKSYWALDHSEKPDFHWADSFLLKREVI